MIAFTRGAGTAFDDPDDHRVPTCGMTCVDGIIGTRNRVGKPLNRTAHFVRSLGW
jgi:hypothetical protein